MRLSLNLATSKYENARAFYLRWGAATLAVLAATVALVWFTVAGMLHARDVSRQVRADRAQIEQLQTEEKRAQVVLAQPANAAIKDRSAFLNNLIALKAFSWTQVFSDLETIMPTRIHVQALRPQLDSSHQLELQLNVAGDSREKALELLRKMEDSQRFRLPQLLQETDVPGGEMQFQISAYYVPGPAPEASAKQGAQDNKQGPQEKPTQSASSNVAAQHEPKALIQPGAKTQPAAKGAAHKR